MDETEEILIDVRFDTNDFAQKAAQLRKGINDLRKENRELTKDINAGTETSAQSAKQFAKNNDTIRSYTATLKSMDAQLAASTEVESILGDTLNEQRVRLSQLTAQYASLSKAERDSARGTELRDKVRDLRNEISETEQSFGDFRRNVGNYPKTVTSIIPGFDKLNAALSKLGTNFQDLASEGVSTFTSLRTSVTSFAKIFTVAPVIIITTILSAILVVLNGLRTAFQRNNDASTSLRKSLATLQPVLNILNKLFDVLATAIAQVVEWVTQAIAAFIKWNPIIIAFRAIFPQVTQDIIEQAEAARELVQAINDIQEAERRYTVESARRSAEIARLRDQVLDKENQTSEERLALLQRAIDLERQNLEDEQNIARERLRILQQQAKQNQDTSDQTLNQIAQAEAAVLRAEQSFYTGTRRLQSQIVSLQREIESERNQIVQDGARTRQAIIDAEVAAVRQYEDEMVKTISDSLDRQIAQMQLASSRQINELRNRLNTERNLTVTAREAINNTIILLEQNLESEIFRLRSEYEKRLSDASINAEVERLTLLLNTVRRGSENEYQLREQQINLLREQALSAENLTQQQRANIIERYDQQIEENRKSQRERVAKEQRQALINDFEERRQMLFGQEQELAELELEFARFEQENLLQLDEETKIALYENQANYEAAVLASNVRVRESTIAVLNTQTQLAERQARIFGATVDAISNAFGEIAGDNAQFAAFLKALALAQASIELGLSIAAATRTAATGGDPYTVAARIISAVGGVVGAFASVVSSINSATIPSTPKFAKGGIVPGASFSGDNVIARVNSGEMILNAAQQARLFEIANNRVSNNVVDYEQLAEITAAAVSNIPAPVVVYSELRNFEQQVVQFDEYASIKTNV